ncbi:hypothetical protein PO124_31555 [Bacillus licheniformis]|nr:hypothetical protein [Bacillus licheniformis]
MRIIWKDRNDRVWSFSPRLSIKAAKVKSCALNAVQGRTFADEQDYKADDEGC